MCSVCVQRRENNYILGRIFSRVGNMSGPCFLGFDSCIYLQVITCFCNFVGCADDHCFLFVAIISIVLDFQVNKSSSHNLLAIPVGINQKRNVDTIARKV